MLMAPMTVTVFVKQEKTQDIGEKAKATDYEDEARVRDGLRFDKSLNSIKKDGQAQGYQEDSIDQGAQRLSSLPLMFVSIHIMIWLPEEVHEPHKYTPSSWTFHLQP